MKVKANKTQGWGVLVGACLGLLAIDALWNDAPSFYVFQLFSLPQLVLACLAGAAYALAGYLFQLCFKNPLASPDIVGVNAGASAGGLLVVTLFAATGWFMNVGAIVGSLVVCVIALYFARPVNVPGFVSKLVLVGIALSSFALSIVAYILSTMPVGVAQQNMQWLTGTLHNADWNKNLILAAVLILSVCALAYFDKALHIMQLPDYSAYSFGIKPQQTRGILLGIGIALAATATAMCGPVLFVAFLSPQLAKLIVLSEKYRLISVALTGIAFMLAADIIAQHIIPGQKYPVGSITGILGAVYLIWFTLVSTKKVSVK